ncbi:hypothetical protein BDZ90DRAFT_279765 [Jaminaea rosea]|uniref:Anaphase-promoting complex subunit 5 domain-containing protein n=1 Tax=Jaminaea rosea TaxID=1569628 RepID=A0A316UQ25_9BASI|nr:hypothetical protein BDZ90DRAFT_279765 [Jaminaea rosea]PWN27412.1 hypothetical protein BDZ90DRAFT_279765 [Jaminaea rosea]
MTQPRRPSPARSVSPRCLTAPHISLLLLSVYWARCRYAASPTLSILDVDVRQTLFDSDGENSHCLVATRLLMYLLRSWDGFIEPAGSLREFCEDLRAALRGPQGEQRNSGPSGSKSSARDREREILSQSRIDSLIEWLEEQWSLLIPHTAPASFMGNESFASHSGVGDNHALPLAPVCNQLVKIVEAASLCIEVTNEDEEDEDDAVGSPRGAIERRSPLGIAIRRMRLALEGLDEFEVMPRMARELARWKQGRIEPHPEGVPEAQESSATNLPARLEIFHRYQDARRRGDYAATREALYAFFSLPPPISHRTRSPLHPYGHPLGPNASSLAPPPGPSGAAGSSTTTGQTRTKLHHHALLNLAGFHVEWEEWDAASRALKEATGLCKAERDAEGLEACRSLGRRVDAALSRRCRGADEGGEKGDLAGVDDVLLREPVSPWIPPSREGTWRAAEATMSPSSSDDPVAATAMLIGLPRYSSWGSPSSYATSSSPNTEGRGNLPQPHPHPNNELRSLLMREQQDAASSSSGSASQPARLTPDDLWDSLRCSTALSPHSCAQILESVQLCVSLPIPSNFLRSVAGSAPSAPPSAANANPHPAQALYVAQDQPRPWATLSRLHSLMGEEHHALSYRRLARAEAYVGDERRGREDEWGMRFDEAWSLARAGRFDEALTKLCSSNGEGAWLRELVEQGDFRTYTQWVKCVYRCLYLWKRRAGTDEYGRKRIARLATGREEEEWDVEVDDEAYDHGAVKGGQKARSMDGRINELTRELRLLITASPPGKDKFTGNASIASRALPLLSTLLHRTRLLGRNIAHRRLLILFAQLQAFHLGGHKQLDAALKTMRECVMPSLLAGTTLGDEEGEGAIGDPEELADGLFAYAQLLLAKARAVDAGLPGSASPNIEWRRSSTASPFGPVSSPSSSALKRQALQWLLRARDAYIAACPPHGMPQGMLKVDVFLARLYEELAVQTAVDEDGKREEDAKQAQVCRARVNEGAALLRRREQADAEVAGGDVCRWDELIARVGAKIAAPRC